MNIGALYLGSLMQCAAERMCRGEMMEPPQLPVAGDTVRVAGSRSVSTRAWNGNSWGSASSPLMILLVIAAELRPQTHVPVPGAGGAEGTIDTSEGSMPKLAGGRFGCLWRYIWLPRAGGADGATDTSGPGVGGLMLGERGEEEGGGLSMFNCSKVFFTMS